MKTSQTDQAKMIIGVPKEIKTSEFRAGLDEAGVRKLVKQGAKILIQDGAGLGSGLSNENYVQAGAEIVSSAKEIYKRSDMIIKVKEPLEEEYRLLQEGQILCAFLHLAPLPALADILCRKKIKAVAYETVETQKGELPLLRPMSRAAGRIALQNGVVYLQKNFGGKGILPCGAKGAKKASVVIIGGGTAGSNAAAAAVGLEARVTLLDISPARLKQAKRRFSGKIRPLLSTRKNLRESVKGADLVISSVLVPGGKAPKLIDNEMIQSLEPGSVAADIAIDQGGSMETSRPTSHKKPVFTKYGVIHYCIPNIPSAVPRTSTCALAEAAFPFLSAVASKGLENALKESLPLRKGLNVYDGCITCRPAAEALRKEFVPWDKLRRR